MVELRRSAGFALEPSLVNCFLKRSTDATRAEGAVASCGCWAATDYQTVYSSGDLSSTML